VEDGIGKREGGRVERGIHTTTPPPKQPHPPPKTPSPPPSSTSPPTPSHPFQTHSYTTTPAKSALLWVRCGACVGVGEISWGVGERWEEVGRLGRYKGGRWVWI